MRGTRGAVRCVLAGVALALAIGVPTSADVLRGEDEDSEGILDIRRWAHRHVGEDVVRHVIEFEDGWDPSVLVGDEQGTDGMIAFGFRVRDRAGVTHLGARVEANPNGSLAARIVDDNGTRGFANVWKPDDHTLVLEVAKRDLRRSKRREPHRYLWRVFTSYHPPEGTGTPCDDVPDDPDHGCEDTTGWIEHTLQER